MQATSPTAETAGSSVRQVSSTRTPPRSPHGQTGGAGQLVPRAHSGGEDDDVGGDALPVGELHGAHPAQAPVHLGRGGTGAHGYAEAFDEPPEGLPAALVDLQRHQPGREFHHGAVQLQRLERAGGLEAEQPATNDDSPQRAVGALSAQRLDVAAQFRDVVDGPVDEAAPQVRAGHRGHPGERTRGEHQMVVLDALAGLQHDVLVLPVDLERLGALAQAHQRVAPQLTLTEVELRGVARR